MKRIFAIVGAAVLCCVSSPLFAQGILLVQTETHSGKTSTNQIQIDKNYMRTESGGSQTAIVFDGPKQLMRTMDLNKKTYQEITRADLEQVKKQMDAAMAQVTPQQRAMIEQMMQGRGMPPGAAGMPGMPPMPGMAAAVEKPEYKAAGTDKVGQWTCTKYEGYVNKVKTVEVCAVDPAVLKLTAADFDVTRQMADFIKSIAPENLEKLVLNATQQEQGYPGVPLRRTTFINGVPDSVMEVKELRRETFPPSTFAVPAGFQKQPSPLAGRGAR